MNSIPQKMKGVLLTDNGGPETLIYCNDIPVPTPREHEVLVKVSAAGVNNTDINTRIGWYSKNNQSSDDAAWNGKSLTFPLIQGADVCGEIVAVGSAVDSQRIGERVLIEPCLKEDNGQPIESFWYLGSECNGGFAEYTTAPARHVYKVNSHYSDLELASFPCSYSTAENLLTRTNLQANEHVLISGASGGVGSAAVQLAKARGAHVIAISSPNKNEQLLELGADEVISRHANLLDELASNSIDVVIDLVAGEQWPNYLEVLKPKGRYAVSGAIGGAMVDLDVRTLYLKDLSFFGCTELEPQVFKNLIKHIEAENIQPIVAHSFPLQDICQAQEIFQEKNHIGKIVLYVK